MTGRDHVDRDLDIIRAWQIRGGLEEVAAAVLRVWEGQTWTLRGYESWPAMYEAEVSEPLRLSRKNRVRLHNLLRDGGMSTRAIAVVTGSSDFTVRQDESQDCEKSRSLENVPATGLDGARRVTDPRASAALTQRILELRATGLSFPEIGKELDITGHAAYQRHAAHRRKHGTTVPTSEQVTQLPTPERIKQLAETGITSMQIAHDLGIGQERVRQLARREGIRLVGDINRGHGGIRTIDMPTAITNWLTHLRASLDSADAFLDLEDIDPVEAAEWAHQLNEISNRVRALTRRFQHQSNPERQAHHGRS
jgi:hypothetical protein